MTHPPTPINRTNGVGVLLFLDLVIPSHSQTDAPVEVPYQSLWECLITDGMKMNRIKTLIRDYEKTKDPFQKMIVLGSIQNELETLKKELSRKIK
jgi:hypothetical protein